jgi:hypothetical protein
VLSAPAFPMYGMNRFLIAALALVAALLLIPTAAQATLATPSEDAHISSALPNSPVNNTVLQVQEPASGTTVKYAYIKFAITATPNTFVNGDAQMTLGLYANNTYAGDDLGVYETTDGWSESTLTFGFDSPQTVFQNGEYASIPSTGTNAVTFLVPPAEYADGELSLLVAIEDTGGCGCPTAGAVEFRSSESTHPPVLSY